MKGVKLASSWYPNTTVVKTQLNTAWIPNSGTGAGTYGNQANVLLNGQYRPFFFSDIYTVNDFQNYCPANFYATSAAGTEGSGLVGSLATSAPYRQYKVLGCMAEVEWVNTGASPLVAIGWVSPENTSHDLPPAGSVPTALSLQQNQKIYFERVIPANTSQEKPVTFKRYFSIRKLAQMTRAQWAADRGPSAPTAANIESYAVPMTSGVGSTVFSNENPGLVYWLQTKVFTMAGGAPAAASFCYRLKVKWNVLLFTRNGQTAMPTIPKVDDDEKEEAMDDWEPEPPAPKRQALMKDLRISSPPVMSGRNR